MKIFLVTVILEKSDSGGQLSQKKQEGASVAVTAV